MEFGEKIQQLRKNKNLSQEALAEKVGVARQTISKWELGETSPDLKQSKQLAKVFEVSLDELADNKIENLGTTNSKINVKDVQAKKASFVSVIGLGFTDLFSGAFFIIISALIITIAIFSVACVVTAICLVGNLNFGGLLPQMPYWCGAIIAICLLSLSVLSATGCVWITAFLRQLMKVCKQFNHKILSKENEKEADSKKSIMPQFSERNKRKLQKIAFVSFVCTIIFLIISLIVCMISAGELDFWHKWKWWV